jgi:hypothetical protein
MAYQHIFNLKRCSEVIAPSLRVLFELSLQQGVFPLACEQALWIELEPAGLVNKNTSVPITIYSVVNQM